MLRHQAVAVLIALNLHTIGCDDASPTLPAPENPRDSSTDDLPDAESTSPSRDAGVQDAGSGDGGTGPVVSLTWRVAAGRTIAVPDGSDGGAEVEPAARDSSLPALVGVKVCLYGAPRETCTRSGADGGFVLEGLPAHSELIVTLHKDGYTPVVVPVYTTSSNLDANAFATAPLAMRPPLGASTLPFAVDLSDKGTLVVAAVSLGTNGRPAGAPGVVVVASPSAGDGPYFIDETDTFDLSADRIVDRAGIYFNVEPGEYEITFSGSELGCSPLSLLFGAYGYPASSSSVRVPVLAGHSTVLAAVLCSPR